MSSKLRIGCVGTIFVVGLLLVLFSRPLMERMSNWMFSSTTERVVQALPEDERADAIELCERFWENVRERRIPAEHAELIKEFRAEAFAMMKNNEVTEEEARAFVARVRDTFETMYPDVVPQ